MDGHFKGKVVLRLLTVNCTEIDCSIFFYRVTVSVDMYICPRYIVNIFDVQICFSF